MEGFLDPDLCRCCETPAARTPAIISNRPGLSAIAYRVGTFATFRQAMLEAIGDEPALAQLTTRESDDYAITLLELWAAVADVLTFYQERIANEAFLRTAVHRDSVLRLARLLDYHLRPGLAARARVAFALDDNATVKIPVGLKLMSVPGQDERPQFFETVENIVAEARFNRVRVLPVPTAINPFSQGWSRAPLIAKPSPFAVGDKLVVFDSQRVEEKSVAALTETDMGSYLSWAPPVQASGFASGATRAAKYVRILRLFGYNAPDNYSRYEPGQIQSGVWNPPPRWVVAPVPENLTSTQTLYPLDSRYDDLKPGMTLLVDTATGTNPVLVVTVVATSQQSTTFGPLTDTVTHVLVTPSLGAIANRRKVRIFQVESPELSFRPYDYEAGTITGSRVVVPLAQLDSIDHGRAVLLRSKDTGPFLVKVTSSQLLSAAGGAPDHLAIDFTPELSTPLSTETAELLCNVTQATHGETVAAEILGDGDGSQTFQRFVLRKSPLTHLATSKSPQGEAQLTVIVNGEPWTRVASLYGQGPNARVYTAQQADDGTTTLQFGDGVTGARLPSGRSNVKATYRQGLGLEGRLRADQLSILLTRPPGLKAVTNPAPAEGGADPESLDQARTNAPTTVKTFGRAVSLADFESLVTISGEVAKAKATWVWRDLEKAVHLTVAAQQGGSFSVEGLKLIHDGLTAARDPNHALLIGNVCRVAVSIIARLTVDPSYLRDEVLASARDALSEFFSFDRMPLGRPVYRSDIYAVLQGVEGVVSVDLDHFHFKGGLGWTAVELAARGATAAPVQAHLRIFEARPAAQATLDPAISACIASGSMPEVLPAEQAYAETADLVLTATGGFA